MPRGVDPNHTVPFSLPADQDKPEDQRPVFYARYLTARQMHECERLMAEAVQTAGDDELEKLFAAYDLLIAGWARLTDREGNPVSPAEPDPQSEQSAARQRFDPVMDVLTSNELWDLYAHAIRAVRADETALGNSASASGSDTGSSAPTAA